MRITTSRTLENSHCYNCRRPIKQLLPGDTCVVYHGTPRYFHSKCVQWILIKHVDEREQRERHIDIQSKREGVK